MRHSVHCGDQDKYMSRQPLRLSSVGRGLIRYSVSIGVWHTSSVMLSPEYCSLLEEHRIVAGI